MSLELTLIPLALVVANVIEPDYYHSWVKGKQLKKITGYTTIEEIIYDLNCSSYRYEKKHDVIRVCSTQEGRAFYYSKMDGKWILSFSSYDDKNVISSFLKEMESISNGKVSSIMPVSSNHVISKRGDVNKKNALNMPPLIEGKVCAYPTIFRDSAILKSSLEKMSIEYADENDSISFFRNGIKCLFVKSQEGQYVLKTFGCLSEGDIFSYLQDLDIVYKKDVQKQVYDNVINRLAKQNIELMHKQVLDDDTIVLTINVD